MSISSSERLEGMMVKGTFIFDICFPVKALISEYEPELLEAKKHHDDEVSEKGAPKKV